MVGLDCLPYQDVDLKTVDAVDLVLVESMQSSAAAAAQAAEAGVVEAFPYAAAVDCS